MYHDPLKRNKEVKQVLSKMFGSKNVSVTNGKGTSWGWCHIGINVSKDDCTGDVVNGYPAYCDNCKAHITDTLRAAEKAIKDIPCNQYYDDENYSNDRQSIHIHLI